MAKKEYKSAIRSRKLIMNALANLLLTKPLDKITVTDIVKKADINRGTFYAHYKDIPDVVHSLVEQTFSRIKVEVLDVPQSIREIPHAFLKSIKELFESNLDFFKKVMTSNDSSVLEEQLVKLMVDYFIQHEDKFSSTNHEKYILTIRFCAGGLLNLYRNWFLGNIPFSLDELTFQAESIINDIIGANA